MSDYPIVRSLRGIANKSGHGNLWATTGDAADLIEEMAAALEPIVAAYESAYHDDGLTAAGQDLFLPVRAVLKKLRGE